jgi:hypothetical protein
MNTIWRQGGREGGGRKGEKEGEDMRGDASRREGKRGQS